jgi:hypothetical protein
MTEDPEMENRRKHWETVLDGKDPIDWIADYEKFKQDANIVFADLQARMMSLEMQIVKLQQSQGQPWTIQQVPGSSGWGGSGVGAGTAPVGSGPFNSYGTIQVVN